MRRIGRRANCTLGSVVVLLVLAACTTGTTTTSTATSLTPKPEAEVEPLTQGEQVAAFVACLDERGIAVVLGATGLDSRAVPYASRGQYRQALGECGADVHAACMTSHGFPTKHLGGGQLEQGDAPDAVFENPRFRQAADECGGHRAVLALIDAEASVDRWRTLYRRTLETYRCVLEQATSLLSRPPRSSTWRVRARSGFPTQASIWRPRSSSSSRLRVTGRDPGRR